MGYLILGSIGFVFLTIFDFNKIKRWHGVFKTFFLIGISLIGLSTLSLFFIPVTVFSPPFWLAGFFYILALLAGLLMFYALFGALPFKKTYVEDKENQTIDTGVYALCRHPGVWGFFMMYLFLFLATGNILLLYACILWTALDIIHVWIQDVYFFPKTLQGYETYQQTTPFLLFNKESFSTCVRTLKRI